MAIAFKSVSAQNSEGDNSAACSITVNFPTNVCGDFLIALISTSSGCPSISPARSLTPPACWTELICGSTAAVTANGIYFAYRFSPGGITSVCFTACCTTGYVSNGIIYTGVCPTTPIDVSLEGCTPGTATANCAPQPTTTSMCTMVLRWMVRDGAPVTITQPACTVGRINAGCAAPGNGTLIAFNEETQVCAGVTAARQFTWAGAEEHRSATVALAQCADVFQLTGTTRDLDLDAVGNVRVVLLKQDTAIESLRKYSVIDHTNSNACGVYNFMCIADNQSSYAVIAYNDEATDRRGVTDDNLTPTCCP